MRRPLTLLLATMITFAPAVSANADSGAQRSLLGLVRAPAAAVVATGAGESMEVSAPGVRVEDALRSAIDPTDVRTQMDAVRLLIEGNTGTRLPDLRPSHTREQHDFQILRKAPLSEEEPPAPEPEPESDGTRSYPSAAGDLSGDGRDDLLSYDYKLPQGKLELRAFRGTDGSQLWKRTFADTEDATALPGSDLTGDGIDDLLLLGLDIQNETESVDCPDEEPFVHCRVDYHADYTWLAGLLSGANGKAAWSHTYPASQTYHYLYDDEDDAATGSLHVEESLTSTNLSVWPMLSGDQDGDDLEDLVIERVDLNFEIESDSERTAVIYQDTGDFQVDSATHADLVRGLDGQNILSRSSEHGPTVAILEPVGNLVGDATTDLLWQNTTYTNDTYSCVSVAVVEHCSDEAEATVRFSLQAIDGSTLTSAWQSSGAVADAASAFPLETDLSGDGTPDLAVLIGDYATDVYTTRILSGRDGRLLWERRQAEDSDWYLFPLATGDLGGGAGVDVALGSFVESQDTVSGTSSYGVRITRVDGATGQTLSETTHVLWTEPATLPETAVAIGIDRYFGGMPDADGDGIHDIFLGGIGRVYEDTGGEYLTATDTDSRALVESSRMGTILLQRDTQDTMELYGVVDLDGDGRAEVFEWHYPLDPFVDDARFELVVQRAAPDAPLFGRSFVGDEFWLGTLWPGGDHDGQPGDELLYGDNSDKSGTWKSLVGSLNGVDGTARWLKNEND